MIFKRGPREVEARPPRAVESAVLLVEEAGKRLVFDCRSCGQCILHSTGFVCTMRCPKNLRNGPCGGVRSDGSCEVDASNPCVWTLAWRRSRRAPWREHMKHVGRPVDWRLRDTSSWINALSQRDLHVPEGWSKADRPGDGSD